MKRVLTIDINEFHRWSFEVRTWRMHTAVLGRQLRRSRRTHSLSPLASRLSAPAPVTVAGRPVQQRNPPLHWLIQWDMPLERDPTLPQNTANGAVRKNGGHQGENIPACTTVAGQSIETRLHCLLPTLAWTSVARNFESHVRLLKDDPLTCCNLKRPVRTSLPILSLTVTSCMS